MAEIIYVIIGIVAGVCLAIPILSPNDENFRRKGALYLHAEGLWGICILAIIIFGAVFFDGGDKIAIVEFFLLPLIFVAVSLLTLFQKPLRVFLTAEKTEDKSISKSEKIFQRFYQASDESDKDLDWMKIFGTFVIILTILQMVRSEDFISTQSLSFSFGFAFISGILIKVNAKVGYIVMLALFALVILGTVFGWE